MSRFITATLDEIEITRAKEVEKHGEHDQSTHGSWATGSGSEDSLSQETAAKIQQFTREWGGLSIKMTDGSMPDKGYMVSKPTRLSRIVPSKDFYDPKEGWKILREYEKEHSADLATGRNYLGTWENEGKVFLDVSQNIMDRDKAISLGASRDQKKIWDVVNQQEIDTGGTGGVKKGSSHGGMERHLGNVRGREGRLRKGTLGEIDWQKSRRPAKVIYFDYGLRPVLKHEGGPDHDQADHGNWATGRSAEDVERISRFKDKGPSVSDMDEMISKKPSIDKDKAELLVRNSSVFQYVIEDRIRELVDEKAQGNAKLRDELYDENYEDFENQAIEDYIEDDPEFINQHSLNEYGESLLDPVVVGDMKEIFNDVYGITKTSEFREGSRAGESITLKSEVEEVTVQGRQITVTSLIKDEQGNLVNDSEIVRVFTKNSTDGTWSVEHKLLDIKPEYRGLGFGSAFLQQSEDFYVAKGLTHITLGAGLQDGARHWANSGFDWEEKNLNLCIRNLSMQIGSLDHLSQKRETVNNSKGELERLTPRQVANIQKELDTARTLLKKMEGPSGAKGDMRRDDFPKPRDFSSLGADKPFFLPSGEKTWAGKLLLANAYLPYRKTLTAEGMNIASGPIDMDGDGLVYDGTPREKPVSSVGKD